MLTKHFLTGIVHRKVDCFVGTATTTLTLNFYHKK